MNINNNSIRHILSLESGPWKKTFFLDKNIYSIGRNSSNSLAIHHRVISRNHASLIKVTYGNFNHEFQCQSIFWIIDGDLKGNKSTNGIYVNGKQCNFHQLQPGDLIFLGGIEVKAKYDIVDLQTRTFFSLSSESKNSLINFENLDNKQSLAIIKDEDVKLFELMGEGVLIIDIKTRQILNANSKYCQLVNYSFEEITTLSIDDLFVVEKSIFDHDLDILENYNISTMRESINKRKDKSFVNVLLNYTPINFQNRKCILVTIQDINELKKVEEVIRYQTTHDSLTNLPNKKLFREQLLLSLGHNLIKQENLAIIKLRFNNWENISYKFNIEKENKLIQMLIEVIRKTLFAGDSLGKWSDNEYIIMVEETKNNNRVNDVIQNILLNINKPLIMDDQCILITANFGISVHPQDGDNIRGLLNKATMALTKSYDKSFNTYQYYSREISSQLMDKKYDFQTLIFKAITEEKFIVKYNPIINVKTNQISGFNSKLFSEEIDLTENEIITLASEIGYTDNLIRLWLEKISQDISFFQENSLPVNKVSLKILLSSLSNIDTVNLLIEIITNPEKNLVNIELEIIIDNYLFDIKIVEENLNKLINISVALSLSNLDINNLITLSHQKVKFTTIKISAFMINELENNSKNLSLIASIINLAKSCKLNLIAEGITTEKQKDILLDLDCQEMEGIFFTPPLLPENIKDFLESNSLSFMSVI